MKLNFNNKGLKEYFESLDKSFLQKVYDDAVSSVESKKVSKSEISKS